MNSKLHNDQIPFNWTPKKANSVLVNDAGPSKAAPVMEETTGTCVNPIAADDVDPQSEVRSNPGNDASTSFVAEVSPSEPVKVDDQVINVSPSLSPAIDDDIDVEDNILSHNNPIPISSNQEASKHSGHSPAQCESPKKNARPIPEVNGHNNSNTSARNCELGFDCTVELHDPNHSSVFSPNHASASHFATNPLTLSPNKYAILDVFEEEDDDDFHIDALMSDFVKYEHISESLNVDSSIPLRRGKRIKKPVSRFDY